MSERKIRINVDDNEFMEIKLKAIDKGLSIGKYLIMAHRQLAGKHKSLPDLVAETETKVVASRKVLKTPEDVSKAIRQAVVSQDWRLNIKERPKGKDGVNK